MNAIPLSVLDLEQSYARALAKYLRSGGEGPLNEAYELGRWALTEGCGVLDMVNLHHEALTRLLRQGNPSRGSGDPPSGRVPVGTQLAETAVRAGEFFAESMSSFEMAHRAIDEANVALRKSNATMEDEVRRIALALHDDAGQLMAAAQMGLDDAGRDLSPATQEKLRAVKTLMEQVDDRLRHLSHELYPAILDHLGLAAALEFLAANLAERSGLHISVRSTLRTRLPKRLASAFYRIVQEALNNVRRHAQASSVHIHISSQGTTVRCTVSDDGVGFEPDLVFSSGQPGLGLLGIHERIIALGGALRIDSAPGRGTKLEITAPF